MTRFPPLRAYGNTTRFPPLRARKTPWPAPNLAENAVKGHDERTLKSVASVMITRPCHLSLFIWNRLSNRNGANEALTRRCLPVCSLCLFAGLQAWQAVRSVGADHRRRPERFYFGRVGRQGGEARPGMRPPPRSPWPAVCTFFFTISLVSCLES